MKAKTIEGTTRTETRSLPVRLTEHELAELGGKVARLCREAAAAEEEKRVDVAEMNQRIAALWQQAGEMSAVIVEGAESRQVEVRVDFSFEQNKVTAVRLDSGEVVEERAMRADEREAMQQPPLAIQELPTCEECGHLEDVHALTYESTRGDDGTRGVDLLTCSSDGCSCRLPIDPAAREASPRRRGRRASGKHAAAGDEAQP